MTTSLRREAQKNIQILVYTENQIRRSNKEIYGEDAHRFVNYFQQNYGSFETHEVMDRQADIQTYTESDC